MALPFNLQIAQARRGLLQNKQNFLTDYRRQSADLRREATSGLRALDIQQPYVNRGILNDFAGRGLAYSSGYGTTLGDASNQFATQRSNIQSSLATTLARMRADKQQAMNEYQYRLGNLTQQHADLTRPQAGNLGFNRPKPKPKPKKKKKKARRMM